jgi:hypothetical protein
MKRFITILMILLISVTAFGQEQKKENKQEDVIITINVSKVDKTLGNFVKFVVSEAKQFKDEAVENMPQETKDNIQKTKKSFIEEMKYAREAIHQGWRQGWRGESYTPPKRK